jgi:hypothetical protein
MYAKMPNRGRACSRGIRLSRREDSPTRPRCPGQTPTCRDVGRAESSRSTFLTSPADARAKMLNRRRACSRGIRLSRRAGLLQPAAGAVLPYCS